MRQFLLTVQIILLCSITLLAEGKSPVRLELKSQWQFRQEGTNQWHKAEVPGTVHTDLMHNKIIENPFYRLNEKKLQWIGEKNWTYETTFDLPGEILNKDHIELIFKGLDTYAKVYLNDSLILSADDMFREWNASLKGLLKASNNSLRVEFRNVFDENIQKWKNAPFRLQSFPNNDQADTMINMYSRKAGFHFGWDWGPRLVTYGIWRPIYIEAWNDYKLDHVQIIQKAVTKEKASITSALEILSDKDQHVSIQVLNGSSELASREYDLKKGSNKVSLDFSIMNPRLWWTNGLGEQYLYNFDFSVKSGNGYLDKKSVRTGIRSLEVVRQKDSLGVSMYVKLNGIPVFMKGADYIPQDNFQNRVTFERYKHMIKSAHDANMNMLRLWGGGIFEEDVFYELCDEYGILIWHDFMFACGMYPADSHYLENVKLEIIDNVKRIRNHPSLALYCGNNENEISWYNWGWKQMYSASEQKQYESDLKKLYYEVIPEALSLSDTTRYYHFSSPVAGFNGIPNGNGDIHYWGVWHGKEPFENYEKNLARFVSEYGFQSYPEMSTIKKYASLEDMNLHSEVMLSHQRCMSDERRDKEYGNRLISTYMERYYNNSKDFESYVYLSQVQQAFGVKMAIESHRRNMPYCMGSLFWQIDDCWPVASWSSIDYFGKWKALQYYAKREYAQTIVSPVIKDSKFEVFIVNDKPEEVKAELDLALFDFSGKQLSKKTVPVTIKNNTSAIYFSADKAEVLGNYDETRTFVLAQVKAEGSLLAENVLFFVYPKDLKLEKPKITMNVKKNSEGYTLELSTDKFAKDVCLSTDEDVFFTDNYFDLIPGISKKLELKTGKEIENLEGKIILFSLIDSYK